MLPIGSTMQMVSVLPKFLPCPNLHFRFMKNRILASLSSSRGASGATTKANSVEINIKVKNGIIHEIDTILLSPEPPIETPGNLIEVLEKAEKFKKILKAIEDVGLTDQFKNIAVATVFAPSDKVFDELEVASPGLIGNLTKEQKIALISR